jgi:ubiquitin carboxyl-terminal hydrolase 4/11/15
LNFNKAVNLISLEECKKNGNNNKKLKDIDEYQYFKLLIYLGMINAPLEKSLKNEKYFGYGKVGLRNIGCTCFMNSVLQCVKNLYQITHYFLAEESSKKELTLIYKDLLLNLCQKNIQSISPKKIKIAIGKKDSDFLEYTPNDSKDFLFDCY